MRVHTLGRGVLLADWSLPPDGADIAGYEVKWRRCLNVPAGLDECGAPEVEEYVPAAFTSSVHRPSLTAGSDEVHYRVEWRARFVSGVLSSTMFAHTGVAPLVYETGPSCVREPVESMAFEPAVEPALADNPAVHSDLQDDLVGRLGLAQAVPRWESSFGARYGGLWQTGSSPSLLCLAVVGGTQADLATARSLVTVGPRDRLEVVSVTYSFAQLVGYKDRAVAIVDAGAVDGLGVSVDDASNTVVVDVLTSSSPQGLDPGQAQALAEIVATIPTDALTISFVSARNVDDEAIASGFATVFGEPVTGGDELGPRSAERSGYPPYLAGLYIAFEKEGHCTAGFAMTNRYGDPVGISAGHCGTRGEDVMAGGYDQPESHLVGTVTDNLWQDGHPSDVNVYTVGRDAATNDVFVAPGVTRDVVERVEKKYMKKGLSLCFSGARSGFNESTCGKVNRTDFSYRENGQKHANDACFKATARRGDSGAPVFQEVRGGRARAAGNLDTASRTSTCFVPITETERIHALSTRCL